MAIQIFSPTIAGQTAAFTVPDPKNVLFQDGKFIVKTGVDYVPPATPSQDELDNATAHQYAKLITLSQMTPSQIQTWVTANVTNLTQAVDALTTVAIAVSVLFRKI